MATIFQSKRIECKLRTVEAIDDGEAWGGSEPYFWPFFYKIDGETVEAQINIDFLTGLEIKLVGEPTVKSKKGSHGNLPSMNNGDRVNVKNSDGRFRDDFDPIPVKVNVNLGSFAEEFISDALVHLDELIGLIDSDRKCPPIDKIDSAALGEFAAEFISGTLGGLPGICGGTYILMEEDSTSESAAEESRIAIKDTIKDQLQEVIDDLNIQIQFPMNMNSLVANLTDLLDTEEDIVDEATDTVVVIIIKDILLHMLEFGLIGSAIGGITGFRVGGFLLAVPSSIVGFIIGALIGSDTDDMLGPFSGLITHFDEDDLNFGPRRFVAESDNGEWRLRGGITFR